MKITVQRLPEFDLVLLNALYEKIEAPNQEFNPSFFDNHDNIFLVAKVDEELAGFLYAYSLTFPDQLHPEMFLYSIDTVEEHRKKGVASRLIETLKNISIEKGCAEIFVPTNKSNEAAMGLYHKTGAKLENDDDQIFVYKLSR